MLREIVLIDEDKCDGCGLCVPACAEGAIQIIDGKARLVSDTLCDGLGACLGHCPQDAIRIERREAAPFDEAAVAAPTSPAPIRHTIASQPMLHTARGGCPGAAFRGLTGLSAPKPSGCPSSRSVALDRGEQTGTCQAAQETPEAPPVSELTHWPVQLRLLSPGAPILHGARLLIAADCVPVALPDFHGRLLRGRAVVIACPKLDDPEGYVEKLTAIMAGNDVQDITVAHMQVPCCTGILHMALEARQRSRRDIPLTDMVIGLHGEILSERAVESEGG